MTDTTALQELLARAIDLEEKADDVAVVAPLTPALLAPQAGPGVVEEVAALRQEIASLREALMVVARSVANDEAEDDEDDAEDGEVDHGAGVGDGEIGWDEGLEPADVALLAQMGAGAFDPDGDGDDDTGDDFDVDDSAPDDADLLGGFKADDDLEVTDGGDFEVKGDVLVEEELAAPEVVEDLLARRMALG